MTASRTRLPLDWLAIAVSLVALALLLSPYRIGWWTWSSPFFLAVAIVTTIAAVRSARTRPVAVFGAVLLALPLVSFGVLFAYSVGLRIPRPLQVVAIGWPQLVFFGSTLWTAAPNPRPVLPEAWAGAITVAFWTCVALAFARLTRRWPSLWVSASLAIGTITATVFLMRAVVPLLQLQLLLESP